MQDFPSWQQGVRPEYPSLRGGKHADIVIVGGGLTGAVCAAMLAGHGLEIVLLEAHRLGCGASWTCTGKLTSQLGSVYQTCADAVSEEAASVLARLAQDAVQGVRTLIRRRDIPCQLTPQSIYIYAMEDAELPALEKQRTLAQRIGLPITDAPDADGCPLPVVHSLVLRDQVVMLPLPYLLALIRVAERDGCDVYEQSPVRDIQGATVYTPEGHVEAASVVLCTGAPIGCKSLPLLALMNQRVCQGRVLTGGAPFFSSHLAAGSQGMNLRPLQGSMLASQVIGQTGDRHNERRIRQFGQACEALLGDWHETDAFIRQDVWSTDGLPLIGAVHPKDGRVLMATGYSGWGLTGSYMAARLLSRQLLGKPVSESSLFLPFRRYPRKTVTILKGSVHPAGAYVAGLARPFAPICPHMGCRLRYNAESRRWECPCHGSTFSVIGEVRDAPALRDAAISRHQRPYA